MRGWASADARRSIVGSIVEKITIGDGEVSIDLFYDPPHAPPLCQCDVRHLTSVI